MYVAWNRSKTSYYPNTGLGNRNPNRDQLHLLRDSNSDHDLQGLAIVIDYML